MGLYRTTYEKELKKLLRLVAEKFPEFDKFYGSDPLVLLNELMATLFMSSNRYITKYIKNQYVRPADEIDTRNKSIMLDRFGVTPETHIPMEVKIKFEYTGNPSYLTDHVLIPRGTTMTIKGSTFTTAADQYMFFWNPASQTRDNYAIIDGYEGEYTTTRIQLSQLVDGRYRLTDSMLDTRTIEVTVDGEKYERVRDARFINGHHQYSVNYNLSGYYELVFPLNYSLTMLEVGIIEITYINSTGLLGFEFTENDVTLNASLRIGDMSLTSETIPSEIVYIRYGDDTHRPDGIYPLISKITNMYDRVVTLEDYRVASSMVPGVLISAAYDISSDDRQRLDYDLMITTPYHCKIVACPTWDRDVGSIFEVKVTGDPIVVTEAFTEEDLIPIIDQSGDPTVPPDGIGARFKIESVPTTEPETGEFILTPILTEGGYHYRRGDKLRIVDNQGREYHLEATIVTTIGNDPYGPQISQYLIDDIKAQCAISTCMSPDELLIDVVQPRYRGLSIYLGVTTDTNSEYDLYRISRMIQKTLVDYFKVGNIPFDYYLSSDKVLSVVSSSSDEIKTVLVKGKSDVNIQMRPTEVPYLKYLHIRFNESSYFTEDFLLVSDYVSSLSKDGSGPVVTGKINGIKSSLSNQFIFSQKPAVEENVPGITITGTGRDATFSIIPVAEGASSMWGVSIGVSSPGYGYQKGDEIKLVSSDGMVEATLTVKSVS